MNKRKIIFLFSIFLFVFFGEVNACCSTCCCFEEAEFITKYDQLSLEELKKSLEGKEKERNELTSKMYELEVRAISSTVVKAICIACWVNESTKKGIPINELFSEVDKPTELVIKELLNLEKEFYKVEEKQSSLYYEIKVISDLIYERENQQ